METKKIDPDPAPWRIVQLQPSAWRRYKHLRLEALKREPSAFAESFREARGKPAELWMSHLSEAQLATQTKLYFAESDHKLIGMIGIEFDLRDKRRHVAKIIKFYVTPEWRSRGIGKHLLNEALGYIAKKRKRIKKLALSVNITQSAAVKLYKRLGFETIGLAKKEIYVHGYFVDQYLMEKYF